MSQIKQKIQAILDRHKISLRVGEVRLAEMATLADGTEVGSPTEIAVDQELWTIVDGVPVEMVPDATHVLQDGREVQTSAGIIVAVTDMSGEEATEMIEELAGRLATADAALAASAAQHAAVETQLAAARASLAAARAETTKYKAKLEAANMAPPAGGRRPNQTRPTGTPNTESERLLDVYNRYKVN